MKALVVLVVILCFPVLVTCGEIYQWVDDRGVTHFTDDPGSVPEDYRSEAQALEMLTGQEVESWVEVTGEEDEGILIEDDLKEKDEAWWRKRAEKWRARLQEGYDEYERVRLKYNALATEFNASKDTEKRKELKAQLDRMRDEMAKSKAKIDTARKMTEEVLPAQAKKAGKPVSWVR